MKSKKVAVLHIASDVITLVLQDSKYTDNYVYSAEQEYDGFFNGEFLDTEGLFKVIGNLIADCEKSTFTKITSLLVGVPGEFTAVITKNLENELGMHTKITEKDIDDLYHLGNPEDQTYMSLSAAPIYYELDDGACLIAPPVGFSTKTLKCLMSYTVCERNFTDLFDKIAATLGVTFNYTSSLHAEAMYVIPENLRDEGVVLVDVGYTTTSVAYVIGDGLAHALSFSVGKALVASDICEVKNISYNYALALVDRINLNIVPQDGDEYYLSVGQEIARYNVKEINEIAIARVENIAEMIDKAIQNSRYEIPSESRVLLTGSGLSSIAGAREIIAKILKKNVEVLYPDFMQFSKPKHAQLAGLVALEQKALLQKNSNNIFRKIFNWLKNN